MPLPADANMAWPPNELKKMRRDLDVAAAWYSGDVVELERVYGDEGTNQETASTFWNRRRHDSGTTRQRLHSGFAGDVALTSSNLLFGEEITLVVADDDAATAAVADAATSVELNALLPEGAEIAAGLGGVFLRPLWNDTQATLDAVQPDAAWPKWRGRQLQEVTFWERLDSKSRSKAVWRHLECWTPGLLENALYMGDERRLGTRIFDLTMHDQTAHMTDVIVLPIADRVMPVWVPNMLPNRRHRGTMFGRSDTAGAESMMDALDEAWTSLMRDIRLGQSRIIVPIEFLQTAATRRPGRRGGGKGFDQDAEVFTPLDMDPESSERAGIQQVQFEIRADEHLRVVLEEMERIVTHAGYSPESFGLKESGRAESGTALRIREGATMRTRAKKQRYWEGSIVDALEGVMAINAAFFGGPEAERCTVVWPEVALSDPGEESLILWRLNQAAALSVEAKVRRAQPELGDDDVELEVERIRDEQGLNVEDPMGGLP